IDVHPLRKGPPLSGRFLEVSKCEVPDCLGGTFHPRHQSSHIAVCLPRSVTQAIEEVAITNIGEFLARLIVKLAIEEPFEPVISIVCQRKLWIRTIPGRERKTRFDLLFYHRAPREHHEDR